MLLNEIIKSLSLLSERVWSELNSSTDPSALSKKVKLNASLLPVLSILIPPGISLKCEATTKFSLKNLKAKA